MTEKYVSGTYDTAIFEFVDTRVRDLLNHIQKEEQQHGEAVFLYMQSKGLYQPSWPKLDLVVCKCFFVLHNGQTNDGINFKRENREQKKVFPAFCVNSEIA